MHLLSSCGLNMIREILQKKKRREGNEGKRNRKENEKNDTASLQAAEGN